ncbi:endonuclease-reverse transcriptase [Elysia marginata]|uniref:Endonuclease-reverse transcriptase n=1 Tax=Elysia marginata TaxID=1093978 RepID=A0AAV4IQ61_9GAST|nr:endonuclease-reverse transcriptase [Elysia marginata]
MGDLNSKIGIKENNEENEWIGPHGIGARNERGERQQTKCISPTHFFRYWTWHSPGEEYKNQVDFIMSIDKDIGRNTEVINHIDIGSDHRVVRARIETNKRLMRLKRIKRKKAIKIDMKQLTLYKTDLKSKKTNLQQSSIEQWL